MAGFIKQPPIRLGEAVAKDMMAIRLGPDLRTVVVGTPGYFERCPPPLTPYDLDRYACIGYRLATSGGLLPWEFEKDGKEFRIYTSGPLVANDSDLPAAAVRAGAVLGYMMEHEVADEIASGKLIQVLWRLVPGFSGFSSLSPRSASITASAAGADCSTQDVLGAYAGLSASPTRYPDRTDDHHIVCLARRTPRHSPALSCST